MLPTRNLIYLPNLAPFYFIKKYRYGGRGILQVVQKKIGTNLDLERDFLGERERDLLLERPRDLERLRLLLPDLQVRKLLY